MALSREDREEIVGIVTEVIKGYDIDFEFLRDQSKKFNESPEGRLTIVEAKVDHLIRDLEETRAELKSEIKDIRSVMVTKDELRLLIETINKRFEDVDKRFGDFDKRFSDFDKRFGDFDKRLDFQGKILIWILGAILTTVVLYGGLIVFLIGKL